MANVTLEGGMITDINSEDRLVQEGKWGQKGNGVTHCFLGGGWRGLR
jgi:hypothetical protein